MCADPGARTPIGASGIILHGILTHKNVRKLCISIIVGWGISLEATLKTCELKNFCSRPWGGPKEGNYCSEILLKKCSNLAKVLW